MGNLFLKQENESGSETIYVVSEDNFEMVNLADTYAKYGQEVGHYDAGDYSLHNSASDAESDCLSEIEEKFSIDCDGAGIDNGMNGFEFDVDSISCQIEISNDLKLEIEAFIEEWEEKNSGYNEVKAYTYWDGDNNASIIIESDDDNVITHQVIEDESEIEALNEAIETKEKIKESFGIHYYKSEDYLIMYNQSASFYSYKILPLDSYEVEEINQNKNLNL